MAATVVNAGFVPAGLHPHHLVVLSNATNITTISTDQRNHAAFAGYAISTKRMTAPTGYDGSTGAGGVT